MLSHFTFYLTPTLFFSGSQLNLKQNSLISMHIYPRQVGLQLIFPIFFSFPSFRGVITLLEQTSIITRQPGFHPCTSQYQSCLALEIR